MNPQDVHATAITALRTAGDQAIVSGPGTRVVDFSGTFAWETFYSPNAKKPARDITSMPITPGSSFTHAFADRPPQGYEPMLLTTYAESQLLVVEVTLESAAIEDLSSAGPRT